MTIIDIKLPEIVEIAPAPIFHFPFKGKPSLATIYLSHYNRLEAVVAAARSGDPILIRLSLDNHDKHGSFDEPH